MKIGLYFGSFNPIHTGHLIIANFMAYNTDLDRVWLILSPQNPLKPSAGMLNEYDRLHLLRLAVEDETRLRASDIEFSLPKPSYTIDTLTYIRERYPEHSFAVIMGSDSVQNLPRWKNYEQLLAEYPIYVYPRPGYPPETAAHANMFIVEAPYLDISASLIRKLIKEEKSARYLLPDKVFTYISDNNYYRK